MRSSTFNFNIISSTDQQQTTPQSINSSKKNSSRRNAWGNFSYADLITHAITSAPEKRLTLSQIYEWMVQNVDYFRNKGDSNSSAGWKVSLFNNGLDRLNTPNEDSLDIF